MTEKRRPPQPLRWMVFTVLAVMLLCSCRAFFDFGRFFLELRGRNFLERGSIGTNEWWCFLSRAGCRKRQRIFSKARRTVKFMPLNASAVRGDSLLCQVEDRHG